MDTCISRAILKITLAFFLMSALSCDSSKILESGETEFVEIKNSNSISHELKRAKVRSGHPRNPRGYIVNSSIKFSDIWLLLTNLAVNGQQWVDLSFSNDKVKVVRIDFLLSDGHQKSWQGKVAKYLEAPTLSDPVGIDPENDIRYIILSVNDGVIKLGSSAVTMDKVKDLMVDFQPINHRIVVGVNILSGDKYTFEIFDLLYLIQSNGCKFLINYSGGRDEFGRERDK